MLIQGVVACKDCGTMIPDFSKVAMDMIGSEYARECHYRKYCSRCAKEHLLPGDRYDEKTGLIVKSGFGGVNKYEPKNKK